MRQIELPTDGTEVAAFIAKRKIDLRSVRQDKNAAYVILEIAVKVR